MDLAGGEHQTANVSPEEIQKPVERKRRGRKKEVAAEDTPKPVKKRGRARKKALCEDDDVIALSPEPEPLLCVPQKKQAKETKPRGRGKKKAPPPGALKVEPAPVPKPAPAQEAEQMPPEEAGTLQDQSKGASVKGRKSSRRKTYVVPAALALEDDDPDSYLINAELDVVELKNGEVGLPVLLDSTVVKVPKPTLQSTRPVPRMAQSPKLLDRRASQSPGTVQGKETTTPKKAKTQSIPFQVEVGHATEQPISGVPFLELFQSIYFEDSREAAREMFSMLIHPVSEEHFLS